jgi:thiamine kinase-like enzyme
MDLLKRYDFSGIPESECHGDLTLQNIMISEEKIYLIDFLDSFFNSWVIDVAKILQDVDLHWSYRHFKMDANLELRLLVAKEEIIKAVRIMPDGDKILFDIYYILLLNILRIYPYAKDDETFSFLEDALSKTFNSIKEFSK